MSAPALARAWGGINTAIFANEHWRTLYQFHRSLLSSVISFKTHIL
jgi:hypothetical protein